MRSVGRAVLAAVFGACLSTPALAAPTTQELYPAVTAALRNGACDVGRLKGVIAAPDFKTTSSQLRAFAYLALAVCDRPGQAKWLKLSTDEPESPAVAWRTRFAVEAVSGSQADALTSLETLSTRWKAEPINLAGDDYVLALARRVRDDPPAYARLLDLLDRADWRPQSQFKSGDWMWADYAQVLADGGDLARAGRVIARMTRVRQLLEVSLDARFTAMATTEPARFDVMEKSRSILLADQKALAANPQDGRGVQVVANDLILVGRHAEALALVDKALSRPGPLRDAQGQDQRNWIQNARATALLGLGRRDEAVDAMRAGAGEREQGVPNISQTINLSGYLNAAGRPEEALKTLARIDDARGPTAYGVMWVAAERVCAYYQLQRPGDAARSLSFTRDHAKDNPGARAKALLCASDLDGLAAHYVSMLSDPRDRRSTLVELSRFSEGASPSAVESQMKQRVDTVLRRDDIRAAIAQAGRLADLPLYRGSLMDLY